MKLDILNGKETQMNLIIFWLNLLLHFTAFIFVRSILEESSKNAEISIEELLARNNLT